MITDKIIELALQEDLSLGDITSDNIFTHEEQAEAVITAKEDLVLCGRNVAKEVFSAVDPSVKFLPLKKDGEAIKKGEKVEEYTDEKIKQIKVSFDYLKKDIDRTFYTKRFTEGEGKKELKRVLEGISVIKDNVGYCQGMNFIAGSMIHLLNSESKAFMVFNCILKEYELKNLFAYVRFFFNLLI